MKLIYYEDDDSVLIKFNGPFRLNTVNITHLALAWLDENGRIYGISFDEASWQLGIADLANRAPQIGWRAFVADGPHNGSQTADNGQKVANDLTFSYFADTDTLAIEFTEGPSTYVVDITNIDLADINADGSLHSITISQASQVLGRDDLAYNAPEIKWIVAPVAAPVA